MDALMFVLSAVILIYFCIVFVFIALMSFIMAMIIIKGGIKIIADLVGFGLALKSE
jgi:hypothetical protein